MAAPISYRDILQRKARAVAAPKSLSHPVPSTAVKEKKITRSAETHKPAPAAQPTRPSHNVEASSSEKNAAVTVTVSNSSSHPLEKSRPNHLGTDVLSEESAKEVAVISAASPSISSPGALVSPPSSSTPASNGTQKLSYSDMLRKGLPQSCKTPTTRSPLVSTSAPSSFSASSPSSSSSTSHAQPSSASAASRTPTSSETLLFDEIDIKHSKDLKYLQHKWRKEQALVAAQVVENKNGFDVNQVNIDRQIDRLER